MKKVCVAASLLLCLFLSAQAFGQTNASLSGTVTDPSGAVVPGASITATNNNTGVVSNATSNAAGVYSFPSLLPGTYTVVAAQQGFQSKTFTKVQLGSAAQVRLNFELVLSGVATQVEITTSAEDLLLESSSSVGDVLPAKTVEVLPLVNRNALDLVKVMSGVVMTDNTIFNANESSFAGVGANGVNIQRDGITVNDVRWPAGINAATRVNPDLVGEFRMILAPVDAEMGRGNAQISISTRSGTNEYHGSLVYNAQNTALDPNTWENKRNRAAPPWRNLHEYTASVGGPIIKNKTFFFVLFDGQVNKIRTPYNVRALTPCAQRGIFRYYDNWNNGNRLQLLAPGATPRVAVVDIDGNPTPPPYLDPANPGSGPHNGILRYASVFGPLLNTPTQADCSDAVVSGAPWDATRPQSSPAYIEDFLQRMPTANNYDIGDGLNTAGHRWSRTLFGADNLFGVGEDTYRRQINVRLDHNFNEVHRINGSWSWEKSWADDNFKTWPDGFGGKSERRPQVLTVNFISSLRPTLLNEFRFGTSRTGSNIYSPYTNPDTGSQVQELLPKMANGVPVVVGPGTGTFGFTPGSGDGSSNYYGGRGILSYAGVDNSPRYSLGDTITWTKGSHSFRFGGEFRRASSEAKNQWTGPFFAGYNSYPYAEGGDGPNGVQGINAINMPGLAGNPGAGNIRSMMDMLVFMSGTIGQFRQWRYINSYNDTTWNDPIDDPAIVRDVVQKEFSLFFKDDWKVTPDLTLNLGVRYDYYGVPYLKNGLTTGLSGGGNALYGLTGSVDNWFQPIARGDVPSGSLTELEFVGPGTANSGKQLYETDMNNFGPAVGFAYQLPFWGKGKTTIRGGYQISYIGNTGNFSAIQTNAGQAPGTTYSNNYQPAGQYMDTGIIGTLNEIPVPSTVVPGLAAFPLYNSTQSITVFKPNYVSPYVQNITFAVTRNVTSRLAVDLRYVGTLTRKGFRDLNINYPNFLTNGLLEAFNSARAGGNPLLLDQLFMGQSLAPWLPPVDGTTNFGGQALRAANFPVFNLPFFTPGWLTNLNQMLANGQYYQLANALNVFGFPAGKYMTDNGFSANFIKANPQFDNATFSGNDGHSNYHSFQAQVTLRPTAGVDFQSTYTWSKNLGRTGVTDPRDPDGDYTLLGSHRAHNWVTYGSWDLPFGPGMWIGGKSSGAVSRIIGGWKLAWIGSVQSGSPLHISAQDMLYGNGAPDLVGDFDFNSVGAYWKDGETAGNYFGNKYAIIPGQNLDPQCAAVDASIRGLCTLQVVRNVETNEIVFQNPEPGTRGNFGRNRLTNLTRWNVDMAISKSVQITENKSISIRVDATNIFNKVFASGALGGTGTRIVFPTAPNVGINSGVFGATPYKVGGRTFQFLARFDF